MATRVCPNCGSQYVASVRRCIDCDVTLVDEVDDAGGEVSVAAASPVGAGGQMAYELDGWGPQLKVALEGMLDRAGVPRVWEAGALVVPAELEQQVDELIATVEGSEAVELDDDVPQIAFEIEGLTDAELADLDARLLAAQIPHAWEESGALLVAEADEDATGTIVGEVLRGEEDDGDDDGLATHEALSALYVAVDKLVKDPLDAKLGDRYRAAAEPVADLGVPYGLDGATWASLQADVAALDALLGGDEPADDADETDGSEAADLGEDAEAEADLDQDGDPEPSTTGQIDDEDDVDAADEDDGPEAVAGRAARALRERLAELV
ncbi:MAG: hypothetical protein KDA98_14920 [Acidimicrobiales bacterium]|nr:hypothetical protein [Acidimicrobiales bacterium]